MEERRAFRERALQRYFAKAMPITLSWDDLDLVDPPLWCGVPVDHSRYADFRHPGFPEICWMERDGRDLLVVTRNYLTPSHLADIERAVGLRVQTWSVEALHGTLLGLLDHAAEVRGLGILRQIDFANHQLEIMAACEGNAIVGIQWSQTRMSSRLDPQWGGERSHSA
jgi:polynucleotide 5'-kinase involved in rRNA processing